MDFGKLLRILGCGIAIQVACHHITIGIAGIPVCILVITTAVTIIVLGGPNPYQVVHALLLKVVEHGNPEFLVCVGTFCSPPEPCLSPVGLILGCRVTSCLVEGAPGGSNASLLQFQHHGYHTVHLCVEILVLPGTFF